MISRGTECGSGCGEARILHGLVEGNEQVSGADIACFPLGVTAPSAESLLSLFVIIAAGVLLGRGTFRGLSLGTSAILFVALLAGHLGYQIPAGLGTFGLVVFVYGVGLTAGPTFFRSLARDGLAMAWLSCVVVCSGAAVTWGITRLMDLPPSLAAGLYAGAMTSTPALGAVTDAVAGEADVAIGFGVAYPIGVIAVVLFVQISGRKVGEDGSADDGESDARPALTPSWSPPIKRWLVEVQNPAVEGKRPSGVAAISDSSCQISRIVRGSRLEPIDADFVFEVGQQVLVVGAEHDAVVVTEVLGKVVDREDTTLDGVTQRRQIVVTSPQLVGRSLRDLKLLSRFGVTVARIRRYDLEFVPSSTTVIEFGDTLSAVGQPDSLREFARFAGHRPKILDETDLLSLAFGLGMGLLVGSLRVELGEWSVSLGIAGGPLLVGLLLAHFRRIGPIVGHLPVAARSLLIEGGLAVFLADAGVAAGAEFTSVLSQYGPQLAVAAGAIVAASLGTAVIVGKWALRLPGLRLIGAACGAMTSTPGLAAVTGKTDSSVPVVSYVAAYPVALALVTLLAPILIQLLR